ncbi:hypothetical protein WMY93_014791 [Mugilogobius chulae]|uniref:Probable RNA-binding protein 46 n=1 Tax=Mugilogobius chulae TaxID=88201 RepID=A0AAW0P7F7_9GOBI
MPSLKLCEQLYKKGSEDCNVANKGKKVCVCAYGRVRRQHVAWPQQGNLHTAVAGLRALDDKRDADSDQSSEQDLEQSPNEGAGSLLVGDEFRVSCAKEIALLALMDKTGYNMVQENGQRKYGGPPPGWEGPPPPRGCEVFVGKIPRDMYEDELVPLFERAGRIYEFRLMMEFSGENRGYAFVMYTNRESAQRAIQMLDNHEIRPGKFIGVCVSLDNCRLFIGSIPKDKKKDEIMEEMKKVTERVVDVIVYPSSTDKTKNRGFAFVEYESHKAAAMARRKLIPGTFQLWGHSIQVDWAQPEKDVDEEVMQRVRVLYVRNLMLTTTEETLEQEFSRFKPGSVERVKKLTDYAFVHYRNRDDALTALGLMNGAVIDGTVVQVVLSSTHGTYIPDKLCVLLDDAKELAAQTTLWNLGNSLHLLTFKLEINWCQLKGWCGRVCTLGEKMYSDSRQRKNKKEKRHMYSIYGSMRKEGERERQRVCVAGTRKDGEGERRCVYVWQVREKVEKERGCVYVWHARGKEEKEREAACMCSRHKERWRRREKMRVCVAGTRKGGEGEKMHVCVAGTRKGGEREYVWQAQGKEEKERGGVYVWQAQGKLEKERDVCMCGTHEARRRKREKMCVCVAGTRKGGEGERLRARGKVEEEREDACMCGIHEKRRRKIEDVCMCGTYEEKRRKRKSTYTCSAERRRLRRLLYDMHEARYEKKRDDVAFVSNREVELLDSLLRGGVSPCESSPPSPLQTPPPVSSPVLTCARPLTSSVLSCARPLTSCLPLPTPFPLTPVAPPPAIPLSQSQRIYLSPPPQFY